VYVDANFQISNVREMKQYAHTLFAEHYDEIARNKQIMVLAPDWDRYESLERGGYLVIIAAWDETKLIGYSVNLISHHLHYKNLFYGHNDLLFVVPEYRKSRVGLTLIKETERILKERGVRLMLWHAKPSTTLDALLPRMHYQVQDIIYSKEL
jgi:predicted GNAT superfamily acetyltransferase